MSVDRADVSITFPSSAPTATLETRTSGPGDDRYEYLPYPDTPTVNLRIAGVRVYGYLADLEAYIDAARECLSLARWHADRLQAEAAERAR